MSLATLALVALATYRTAYLVVYEDGPWNAAQRLRSWVANHYGLKSWQHAGINCVYCVSFWVALAWAAVALFGGAAGAVAVLWWGAAGGALVVHAWLTKRG